MRALLFLNFLFLSFSICAIEVYTPKEERDVPAEVSLILRSLPPENLDSLDKKKVVAFVDNFSQYSKLLPKSDIFFIVKTEVSKLILSSRPDTSSLYKGYNAKRVLEIEDKADWPAYSPWAQYVARSLLKDAKVLVNDSRFPSLWVNTPNAAIEGLQVLRKRVELVISWIDFFAFASTVSFNEKIDTLALKTLGRIEQSSWLLLTTSYSAELKPLTKEQNLFHLSDLKTQNTLKTSSEVLDEVIDPLLETTITKLPLPVNDWVPREIDSAPFNGETIIKKKDPFYSAPVLLPKPTNDWILSL